MLVASELLTDLNDTFTMTYKITDPLYVQEASVAGFLNDETITVKDLFYGTKIYFILPQMIRKRKIIDKKKKKLDPAL